MTNRARLGGFLVVAVVLGCLLPRCESGIRVGYVQDFDEGYTPSDIVVDHLVNNSNGQIDRADVVNANNGTEFLLTNISQYDVLLIAGRNRWFDDVAFSNILVKYIQDGGAIVVAFFAAAGDCALQLFTGEFRQKYTLFNEIHCIAEEVTLAGIGEVEWPNHPVLGGVSNFTAPYFFIPFANSTVSNGTYMVSTWSQGSPMIVVKDNVGPHGKNRVDLGFWPNRDTLYFLPEIQQIEVNAVLYAAGKLPYFSVPSDQGSCTVPNASEDLSGFLASGETISQTPAAGTELSSPSTVQLTVMISNAMQTEQLMYTGNITCASSSASSSAGTQLLPDLWLSLWALL